MVRDYPDESLRIEPVADGHVACASLPNETVEKAKSVFVQCGLVCVLRWRIVTGTFVRSLEGRDPERWVLLDVQTH